MREWTYRKRFDAAKAEIGRDDVYQARAALAVLDRSFCGGVCRGAHELVRIVLD